MDIPPHTRAYILSCIDDGTAPDRTRIAAETGLGCDYVLSIICRVVSERHGIPTGEPWKEQSLSVHGPRKLPKSRANLKPCNCNQEHHTSRCPVAKRAYHANRRAKVST